MREGLQSLSRGLAGGAVIALAVLALGAPSVPAGIASAVIAVGGTVSLAWAWAHQPSVLRAARQADRQRSLRNRLATATELLDGRINAGLMGPQLADATKLARSLPAARAFPMTNHAARNAAVCGLLALVAFVGGLVLVQTTRSTAADVSQHAVPESAAEALAEPPPTADTTSVPTVSAQQLREMRARSVTEQAALAVLADRLKNTAAARDVGQALQRGDIATASMLLNQLATDSDQLSVPAKQELAGALLNASKGSLALDKDLASAELAATQAMTRSDYQSARKALQGLASAVLTSQAGTLSQQQLVQQIQQLERQGATQGNGAECGVLTDDGEFFQDCSAAGQAMSSGAMGVQSRGVGQSPTAGAGEVAGGHGFATSGVDLDPLGQTATHVDLPSADVPVDVPLSNGQGNGTPADQKAPTLAISQSNQQGVTQLAGPQSSTTTSQPAERTVVGPAERATVREFFQPTTGGTP